MSAKKNDQALETNMDERISRRSFIRWSAAGLGVAASVPLLSHGAQAAQSAHGAQAVPASSAADGSAARSPEQTRLAEQRLAADRALAGLVAPIAVGTVLGGVRVDVIGVDERGVGVVTLADTRGRRWDAEICRRAGDDANVRPLAVSKSYSIYLRNNGSGSVPTDEKIGRAVLAVGDAVRRNEQRIGTLALLTRKELWRAQGFAG